MTKSVIRLNDICSGHGAHPPRPCVSGSPNVFVNGKAIHRAGDIWAPHPHPGILASGSSKVFANMKAVGRIGDAISCKSVAVTGSPNVNSG